MTTVHQAKRFAKAMHSSLIFCSTSASINVQKIFKIVLAKAFDLKCVIPEIEGAGEPVLIYVDVWEREKDSGEDGTQVLGRSWRLRKKPSACSEYIKLNLANLFYLWTLVVPSGFETVEFVGLTIWWPQGSYLALECKFWILVQATDGREAFLQNSLPPSPFRSFSLSQIATFNPRILLDSGFPYCH
jgi:hypothetical protein